MGRNKRQLNHICGRQSATEPGALWEERYSGCCVEGEWAEFQALATEIMQVQVKNMKHSSASGGAQLIDRAFHAKPTLEVVNASLYIRHDLPPDLCTGFIRPGKEYPTCARFSNASGERLDDRVKDLRGVALRIRVDDVEHHDLLMTNFPVSHARDAQQFVKFAKATAGDRAAQVVGVARLVLICGLVQTIRMLMSIRRALRRPVDSIATQTYWSRGAIRWGETLAVRYLLRPAGQPPPAPAPDPTDPNFLNHEITTRLARGEVTFELCVQKFQDEKSTPIENTAKEWKATESPIIPVATLVIRAENIIDTAIDRSAITYNPWNTTDEFRPLGNLNRARKTSYDTSGDFRNKYRWHTDPPPRNIVLSAIARGVFRVINRFRPWYRIGVKPGVINILALRQTLMRQNRFDTDAHEAPPVARAVPSPPPAQAQLGRTLEGTYNDLSAPQMGAVQASFGRNLRPQFESETADITPNPVEVSDRILARTAFRPATSLNVLAAAWIQFQIHDWVNHARWSLGEGPDVVVPLRRRTDRWRSVVDGPAENVMRIAGNQPRDPGEPDSPLYNKTTFWGDASELYGTDEAQSEQLRIAPGPAGRAAAGAGRRSADLELPDGFLPRSIVDGGPKSGFTESWWLGLSAMHTLFVREHNAVCAELRKHHREKSEDEIFRTARLIVSALIAKIHTLEWTPAILATPTLKIGMNANWYGPQDWLTKLSTWLIDEHARRGIPATDPDHGDVPYSLTEDFTAVYRLHPLIPDHYLFSSHSSGETLGRPLEFREIQGAAAEQVFRQLGMPDVLYSFGTAFAGAITLHNFPAALRQFERVTTLTNGEQQTERIDLAVVDLMRTRKRGVPRYNDFRVGLHMPRIKKWSDLTKDPADARLLEEVYGNIDRVDTMVGLFAETPPEGFGLSDTAFRIFISTATLRIQSDRFLTAAGFHSGNYTQLGMNWVRENTMNTVIARNCPELKSVVPAGNAFAPWR